jgi:hypothetical protein
VQYVTNSRGCDDKKANSIFFFIKPRLYLAMLPIYSGSLSAYRQRDMKENWWGNGHKKYYFSRSDVT